MKILLVEDDDRIARPIIEELTHQKCAVDHVDDGQKAWSFLTTVPYDLVVLDLMLPGVDGLTLCRRLRERGLPIYIIIITARDRTSDKVVGLDSGADDYLVKPFDLEELSARVRALSRRTREIQSDLLIHGPIRLDGNRKQITCHDFPLLLTPKEFMIMECFLRQPTQVFTRLMLIEQLWETDDLASEATVRTHITNIRGKLRKAGFHGEIFEALYGIGYRLAALKSTKNV